MKSDQEKSCEEKLIWAFQELGYNLPQSDVRRISNILVQTMTGNWRYFHTLDHIFMVGDSDNPLEVLAALFHDWIYVQVDNNINLNLAYYLAPFIQEESQNQYKIRDCSDLAEDLIFEITLEIFGFKKNQILPHLLGQNEYLSALAAAKILEPFLPLSIIAKITAMIEATIPFRHKSQSGFTPSECLYQRLQLTNKKFNLGLSLEEIQNTIKYAVRLANRDVKSFAASNPKEFLDNTWKLLPETNHNLTQANSFTIKDYRLAIQKMEIFLYDLQPELVFSQFNNFPSSQNYATILTLVKHNLAIGKLYLTCKFVAISLIEAISLKLGNQLIFQTVMSNLVSQDNTNRKLSYFLDLSNQLDHEYRFLSPEYKITLNFLQHDEFELIDYNFQESYFAYFLVSQLGFKTIINLRDKAINFTKQKLLNKDFIACFPSHVVKVVTDYLIELFKQNIATLSS